jgi:hypothetical protein
MTIKVYQQDTKARATDQYHRYQKMLISLPTEGGAVPSRITS